MIFVKFIICIVRSSSEIKKSCFFSFLSLYVDVWNYHCLVDVFFNAKKSYETVKYDVSRFSVEVSTTKNVR